jgi:hypothetical protein
LNGLIESQAVALVKSLTTFTSTPFWGVKEEVSSCCFFRRSRLMSSRMESISGFSFLAGKFLLKHADWIFWITSCSLLTPIFWSRTWLMRVS